MITLNSIDRKLDTFKQTLDTIRIKHDQYIFSDTNQTLQYQLDCLQIATYDIISLHFHNIDQTSTNRNSRTAYQPLRDRRDLLNLPNHIHKPTNYIYSYPRQ